MFEDLGDAAVVEVITAAARAENAAAARRLAAIGELHARRAPDDEGERAQWLIDGYENVIAEVAAALGMTRGRAAVVLHHAISLRDDLPRVAAVFATGVIDARMIATLVSRTLLITDRELLALVDAALATHAPRWRRLSHKKLIERIDWWVAWYDPAGMRVAHQSRDHRYVLIEPSYPGMAEVSASIPAAQAVLLDERLDQVAATVCGADPRTHEQRRADALGALAAGRDRLGCGCASTQCPAGTDTTPLAQLVIHVLADQPTVTGAGATPGYVIGHGPVPAAMVRQWARTATIKALPIASPDPQTRYRPSAGLAAFVRARDLSCRFPGCDRPAQVCDLDHTLPYPLGPTHPANLKLLCRAHHYLNRHDDACVAHFYTGIRADAAYPLSGWVVVDDVVRCRPPHA